MIRKYIVIHKNKKSGHFIDNKKIAPCTIHTFIRETIRRNNWKESQIETQHSCIINK